MEPKILPTPEQDTANSTVDSQTQPRFEYPLDPVAKRMVQEDSLLFRSIDGRTMSIEVNGLPYTIETGGGQAAYKAVNETVNNSTTLQNDNDLFVQVEANEAYAFEVYLRFSSSTTADLKIKFDVPSGANCSWQIGGVASDNEKTDSTSQSFNGAGVGTIQSGYIYGSLVNGATAGNLQLTWAQFTGDATNTVMHIGSWIKLQKLS